VKSNRPGIGKGTSQPPNLIIPVNN